MQAIIDIITGGEFEHFGLRAHRGDAPVVGQILANSRVWVDGECTDDELSGVSTLAVTAETVEGSIETLRSMYGWGDAPVILVAGDFAEHGEDDGELIIRRGVCLAILA